MELPAVTGSGSGQDHIVPAVTRNSPYQEVSLI